MDLVSVIVPLYNAREYLAECIESIISQSYPAWELLLVDSGSTDGSRELCEEYAGRYENVQVLYQENHGISAARNLGLEKACGTYVAFVDADDYLADRGVLMEMVQALEQSGADIAVGNYKRLWNGRLLPAARHSSFSGEDTASAAFRFQGFFSVGVLSYVWCKLYRHSFFREHGLQFGDFNYAEDKMFNYLCYLQKARYVFVEKDVYVYRKNESSVSYIYREDSKECWMRIAEEIYQSVVQAGVEPEYGDLAAYTIFFAAFFDAKMKYLHAGRSVKAVREVLRAYRGYPLAKKYFAEFAKGKLVKRIPSILWKAMIWGFSAAMYFKCYLLLAVGIKLLIELRIDERLSDTGLRE